MSSPWAITHAMASCAGVQPCAAAMSRSRVATAALARRLSPRNRGCFRRTSSGGSSPGSVKPPARKPRPIGLYATKPMPSSRTVGRISRSGSRDQRLYSVCSAVIGWVA